MALSIKNPRAEQLAQEVAELSENSITGAVIEALEIHKKKLLRDHTTQQRLRRAYAVLEQEIWSLPDVQNDLTDDQILGYGPSGAGE